MQVAFESLALLVRTGDDARSGCLHLGQLGLHFRLQSVVLDGRRRGRRHRLEERRVLVQGGVVHDRPERLSLTLEEGERAGGVLVRQFRRLSGLVDVGRRVRRPHEHRNRVIA